MPHVWPKDTDFALCELDVLDRDCPACGRMMHVCDHRYRHFFTLGGPVELVCRLNHCPDPRCPGHARTRSPEVEPTIALPGWVQYARAVRGSTMVERNKEYVQAARVIGVAPLRIMLRHVLPNVMGPVLVLSTIQVAVAILAEATLSFLGVGVSPTSPSLGTFINEGNKQLFSGAWWLVIFPGSMLVLIALSINLFGDWLRDALNPRLR